MITSILFDLGDTLVHLDRSTYDVMEARVQALHKCLLDGQCETEYGQLREVYYAVHSELSMFSQETGVETTTSRVLEEVLARMATPKPLPWTMDKLVRSFFEPEIKSWILYDDAIPTLSTLRDHGYRFAVVSNARSHWAVVEIMKRLKIDRYFQTILTSASVGLRKPRPEIYLRAMNILGSSPDSTVMIGNSLGIDVLGAKKLNARALHIEREIAEESLVEPDATIKSLSEILEVIRQWNKS